jgi:hypothetical protein
VKLKSCIVWNRELLGEWLQKFHPVPFIDSRNTGDIICPVVYDLSTAPPNLLKYSASYEWSS